MTTHSIPLLSLSLCFVHLLGCPSNQDENVNKGIIDETTPDAAMDMQADAMSDQPDLPGDMLRDISPALDMPDSGTVDLGALDSGSADLGDEQDLGEVDMAATGPINLVDHILTNRSGDCATHVFQGFASVMDVRGMMAAQGSIQVDAMGDTCTLSSNAIPNHDFNDGDRDFASPVAEISSAWNLPRNPTFQPGVTELTLQSYDAVMLNGVVIDLLSAGCKGVGDERVGCNDLANMYRFDPMSSLSPFSTDSHNAHTQPDGRYHYHGNPEVLYAPVEQGVSSVVGFAADGFPIYGPFFDDGTEVRAAKSGYTIKQGPRPVGGADEGDYDGAYIGDYEFTDAGDLDECNGMEVDGQYGYYMTSSYPWVLKCFRGMPDASFNKRR